MRYGLIVSDDTSLCIVCFLFMCRNASPTMVASRQFFIRRNASPMMAAFRPISYVTMLERYPLVLGHESVSSPDRRAIVRHSPYPRDSHLLPSRCWLSPPL